MTGIGLQVEIQALNKKWESSLMIGISKITCTNNLAPATALSLKGYDSTWIISGDSVYSDGLKVNNNFYKTKLSRFKFIYCIFLLLD